MCVCVCERERVRERESCVRFKKFFLTFLLIFLFMVFPTPSKT